MKYRVTTRATVERVYLVNAENEKDAIQASCEDVSDFEHTIEEETLSVVAEPDSAEDRQATDG